MRVVVFAERLAPPPDEGIKNTALHLAAALRGLGHATLFLTAGGADWPEHGLANVEADRLLRSPELATRMREFAPDAVVYVPTASLTLASGVRARVLKRYARGAAVALVALQGRRHKPAVRLAARLVGPDLCVAHSSTTLAQARRLGWRAAALPPGVDLETFCPAGAAERRARRAALGLPEAGPVVLHAGHLNRSRGVLDLAAIADLACPVLVASTSTMQDSELAAELTAAGVRVICEYVPRMVELYQAADLYLFPTRPDPLAPSSMDVPLSALEAAACDLPIVARPFGALPELWPAQPGVTYYDDRETLRAAVRALNGGRAGTRRLAEPFGWPVVAAALLTALGK